MNSYELSRNYFDWCFENPEKVSPNHTAIYFFAIEHCNRLGWREKFGFPTQMAMDAIGIKKNQTYTRYLNELVDFGFIKMVQKSTNQYSANIISLISAIPKNGKALDKAIVRHTVKQTESIGQSNSTIDKPITNKQITIKPTIEEFIEYALENKPMANKQELIFKYKSWENNDWCITRKDKKEPIKIWKTTLLNTLKYISEEVIANPHGLSPAQLENNRIAAINIQEAIKQKAIDKELDRQDELRRKQQNQ